MTVIEKMLSRKEGGIGYVIFKNPERHNAVSLDMWEAASRFLDNFRNDKSIRVVVLTGAGGKAFVSGADISKFEEERSDEKAIARYNKAVDQAYTAVYEFPKPTIAMIRGYCLGGGVGLAVCCDLRICSDNSRFAVPAAKLGLGYGYTGIKRLSDIVRPAFTKEIFFTARQFDATEAQAMGLVNRVVPKDELETYVRDYAAMIVGTARISMAVTMTRLRPSTSATVPVNGAISATASVPAVMMVEISAAPAPNSCDSSGRIACGEYRLMKAQ